MNVYSYIMRIRFDDGTEEEIEEFAYKSCSHIPGTTEYQVKLHDGRIAKVFSNNMQVEESKESWKGIEEWFVSRSSEEEKAIRRQELIDAGYGFLIDDE